jgi:hypothetical protein
MKKILIPLLFSVFTLLSLGGCSDDEKLTGTLHLSIRGDAPTDARIYNIADRQNEIKRVELWNAHEIDIELNPGDYLLETDYYSNVGFQIQAGKTTTATQQNGNWKVTY